MSDSNQVLVSGSTFDEFSGSLTNAIQSLPPQVSKHLRTIRRNYFAWYGFEGSYQRMNGRTVGQILAEYQPLATEPIASGVIDGVEYRLDEAMPPRQANEETLPDEGEAKQG